MKHIVIMFACYSLFVY